MGQGRGPSHDLRTWYGHDPAKFGEFCRRYAEELSQGTPRAALEHLAALAAGGDPVTLLTATRTSTTARPRYSPGCSASSPPLSPPEAARPACYAHLVCPECGAVTTEGHRPDCASA